MTDVEADQDIEATFDTASDLALDSGDEDLKEVDDSSADATTDGEPDVDTIQDTAPQHTEIEGNIETRETCTDVCAANAGSTLRQEHTTGRDHSRPTGFLKCHNNLDTEIAWSTPPKADGHPRSPPLSETAYP